MRRRSRSRISSLPSEAFRCETLHAFTSHSRGGVVAGTPHSRRGRGHHRQPPDRRIRQSARRRSGVSRAVQGTRGDQHHALGGLMHRSIQCDEGAPERGGLRGRTTARHRAARSTEGWQPDRGAAGFGSETQTHPAARTHRRGRGESRRLGTRSVQARRGGWILLRARIRRRQGHGRGVRRLAWFASKRKATARNAPSSWR